MATRYNEPIPSQQMSEGILQVVQKKQIRNWQSTTSGFLLDWRNELMASLTCARSSTGCTALRAGVYQSILNPQRKGCCSKTKADEFGWQTDQHLFFIYFSSIFPCCLIIPDLIRALWADRLQLHLLAVAARDPFQLWRPQSNELRTTRTAPRWVPKLRVLWRCRRLRLLADTAKLR